jgi:amino acid permease
MEIITLSIFLSLTITLVFDLLSSAAAETRNPRKNLVTAMRIVFFQIFICYVSRVLSCFVYWNWYRSLQVFQVSSFAF